ncbi:hydroxypyruvate reductase [Caulobacter rhizosphaerae]|uniref:Hydroxypyruvate reductase n=1 Tax=Caulobacter rhizosphaerae TaxID=2010972 RepID=A0ABU1MWD3_9CAUL|nr:glycerate kinase [Caulobacter rhizosphaerae]MDR6530216.1 hydroxypyruvate reductase [Caulobacter rhizosphaerae]
MDDQESRRALKAMFEAAVAAASPASCVAPHLPERPRGRTVVIGAGKAAAAMALAVEAHWDGPLEGMVITRYGHGAPCRRIRIVEAGHPVSDAAGLEAAADIVRMVGGLSPDDLVLCLLSGGGSALLSLPAPGLSLADKQAVGRALLRSGAPIGEMNCVRKHLSAVKGGRLALLAAPARVVTLAISDVPGDDPSVIASGPTVADPTTRHDALAILKKRAIGVPPRVRLWLEDPRSETPKAVPGAELRLVARPREALEAAAKAASGLGLRPVVLGDGLEGEARLLGAAHARLALETAEDLRPGQAPVVLISGGETTVTVQGRGRGGRNAEYLLAHALELAGRTGIHALAADTDGIDGSQDNAGAILSPDSLSRALALGVRPAERLADNDAYSVFAALGDLLVTGPTRTNVNDFRATLINAPSAENHP